MARPKVRGYPHRYKRQHTQVWQWLDESKQRRNKQAEKHADCTVNKGPLRTPEFSAPPLPFCHYIFVVDRSLHAVRPNLI
jgi:hypothetical protein